MTILSKTKTTNIFINTYSGLGDAIAQGQFILEISKKYPGLIYCLYNQIYHLYKELDVDHLSNLKFVDVRRRRFIDYDTADIIRFMGDKNIDFVLNLRRDYVKHMPKYQKILKKLKSQNIKVVDLTKEIPRQSQKNLHFYDMSKMFFEKLNIEVPEYFGWLRRQIKNSNWQREKNVNRIGFFLGASQSIKRLNINSWIKILDCLNKRIDNFDPVIIFGKSKEEIDEGVNLSNLLAEKHINFALVKGKSLYGLSQLVSGLKLVVSPDSFMVYLAESLGVNVFGIYLSTDSKIYGPLHELSNLYQSPFYYSCKHKNEYGNCAGWDQECVQLSCKKALDPEECAEGIFKTIRKIDHEG